MSLLIIEDKHTLKGLNCCPELDDIKLEDINQFEYIVRYLDTVIITDGNKFKILKDRHDKVGIHPTDISRSIKDLIYFIYKFDIIERGGTSAKDWIMSLTKVLDSKQLTQLSKEIEKMAFEKS